MQSKRPPTKECTISNGTRVVTRHGIFGKVIATQDSPHPTQGTRRAAYIELEDGRLIKVDAETGFSWRRKDANGEHPCDVFIPTKNVGVQFYISETSASANPDGSQYIHGVMRFRMSCDTRYTQADVPDISRRILGGDGTVTIEMQVADTNQKIKALPPKEPPVPIDVKAAAFVEAIKTAAIVVEGDSNFAGDGVVYLGGLPDTTSTL